MMLIKRRKFWQIEDLPAKGKEINSRRKNEDGWENNEEDEEKAKERWSEVKKRMGKNVRGAEGEWEKVQLHRNNAASEKHGQVSKVPWHKKREDRGGEEE